MPYEVNLGMPPAGISLHAAREGENVSVKTCEFLSTVDGQVFQGNRMKFKHRRALSKGSSNRERPSCVLIAGSSWYLFRD